MGLDRNALPSPAEFYANAGLELQGRGKWRTTRCEFHGGSDSMRIHLGTGGFICMSCNAKGGDVLAYAMASHGIGFIEAAKELGAWVDDGRDAAQRPTSLSARHLLSVLAFEAQIVSIVGSDMAKGLPINPRDLLRLQSATGRITHIAEAAAA